MNNRRGTPNAGNNNGRSGLMVTLSNYEYIGWDFDTKSLPLKLLISLSDETLKTEVPCNGDLHLACIRTSRFSWN